MLLTLAVLAHATSPEPLRPGTGPRTVKIDLFNFAPGHHPWGSDWKVLMLETWSVVLMCEPAGGRVETCTFQDGVWWGSVPEGSEQLTAVNLPAPGTIEVSWTPRGRLGSWDVKGDRTDFWHMASNTMLRTSFHRPDVHFQPDGVRQIGQGIEQAFVRQLASALEWELPKKGVATGPWSPSQTPWVGRRWVQAISSHKVALSVVGETEEAVELAMQGLVSEQVTGQSMADFGVQTQVVGTATFDRATGKIVRAKTETLTASTSGPLVGHTRSIVLVTPWAEGDATDPAAMPEPTL